MGESVSCSFCPKPFSSLAFLINSRRVDAGYRDALNDSASGFTNACTPHLEWLWIAAERLSVRLERRPGQAMHLHAHHGL